MKLNLAFKEFQQGTRTEQKQTARKASMDQGEIATLIPIPVLPINCCHRPLRSSGCPSPVPGGHFLSGCMPLPPIKLSSPPRAKATPFTGGVPASRQNKPRPWSDFKFVLLEPKGPGPPLFLSTSTSVWPARPRAAPAHQCLGRK